MNAKWIWYESLKDEINTRGCFAAFFRTRNVSPDDREEPVILRICAMSRYIVRINGQFVGDGPIRSGRYERVFDTYDISLLLLPNADGENLITAEVWNYGLSNYQNIAERPAICFEITQRNETLLSSDEKISALKNPGYISEAPKRNVNLGFTDYFDGRKFSSDWYRDLDRIRSFGKAVLVPEKDTEHWKVSERPVRSMNIIERRAKSVEKLFDVRQGFHVVTVNLRNALFPERCDADETTMEAFLISVIHSDREENGTVSFPNRAWNGIIGDFLIGNTVYPVTDAERDHIPVHLRKGDQLFILHACGTFDDLYCHIESDFPGDTREFLPDGHRFAVVGPSKLVGNVVDGMTPLSSKKIDSADRKSLWQRLIKCKTIEEVMVEAGKLYHSVEDRDVYDDAYILSLMRKGKEIADYSVKCNNLGILWNNPEVTVIKPPANGIERRVLLDFGSIVAGRISMTIKAPEGTVVDLYGFENFYHREIDYTYGLNNAVRYIAHEGWQNFSGMARLGFRYLCIAVRDASGPVAFRDLHVDNEIYSVSNIGRFECSDEKLNRIFEMCKETNLLCTEDSFTDSPTYEQSFWIGDAYISSRVNAWLYGDVSYELHCAALAERAFENTELMNALAPTDWNTSIPMWMINWVQSIFDAAKTAGDPKTIEPFYPKLFDVLKNYSKFVSEENGFYISSWNLIDWAAMDVSDDGCVTAQEGMLAGCYGLLADYARESGRSRDADFLERQKNILVRHINTFLWNSERQVYYDGWTRENGYAKTYSIQTHLLLCYAGVVPKERLPLVEKYLVHTPDDFVKVGSPFILFYLYEACIKLGMKDFVIQDIRKRWSDMLRYDSTTCWEVFPGFYENSRTRSYCHSWSSSPAYFLMRCMSGLEFSGSGFSKVTVGNLPKELSWCRVSVPTVHGCIRIEWYKDTKDEQAKVIVLLTLPEKIEYDAENEGSEVTVRIHRTKAL
ncbi:MAG: family 78 glycoside hydrolase catalytic domain [Oribacterium sp.]|nr:family 78 glycoside hydrolase catalytic domain [Oribacterium sp.]